MEEKQEYIPILGPLLEGIECPMILYFFFLLIKALLKPFIHDKEPWKKHLKRGVIIFVVGKMVMGLQNVVFPKPSILPETVSGQLESLYDDLSSSFSVLDRDNVTFLQRPGRTCAGDTSFLFMALTAPGNTGKRERLRRILEGDKHFLLFLLGKTYDQELQEQLTSENLVHGDLMQISVQDHYSTLAYKTLSGFIWANRFCGSVRYIIKIDDDINLDVDSLRSIVETKYKGITQMPDLIECPSVMRNMRPWRQSHPNSLMGKWSISKEAMPRRVYPSFCPGWLYLTTPRTGLALAEVSVRRHKELSNKSKLDDIFVTGFIREYLPHIRLSQFSGGLTGSTWNNFFSHCPFLGITKTIFFNDVVTEKGSGSYSYINSQRLYWCAFLEYFILENLEYLAPSVEKFLQPLWAVCHR